MLHLDCPLEQREKDDTGTELGLTSRPQLRFCHLYLSPVLEYRVKNIPFYNSGS